jgi:hypothetical protein
MRSSHLLSIVLFLIMICPTSKTQASTPDRFFIPWTFDAYCYYLWSLYWPMIQKNYHQSLIYRFMPALSIGDPQKGRVLFAHKLSSLFGLHVLDSEEAYTTYEVALNLYALNAIVRITHPNGSDLMVNDISQPSGGVFKPHKTHQNGVDVDLRYYLKNVLPNDHEKRFVHPSILDEKRMWTLLELLVHYQLAESVLMDKSLQKALYDYAIKQLKWSPKKINKYISYPRGSGALVKHVPNHYHHFHIRFFSHASQILAEELNIDIKKADEIHQQFLDQRTGFYEYKIKDGENLGSIAKILNVSMRDLMNWNGLSENSLIRSGQMLKVWR